jgi:hypothetical protein
MANELLINYPTGATLYALLFDATGQVWNGSAFVAPGSAAWTDYDIAMSEVATATGLYRASMPAAAAGVYGWTVRKQAGGAPAVGDIAVGAGEIRWTGTAEETVPASANVTQVKGATISDLDGSGFVYVTLASPQQVRDAMKLGPSSGSPSTNSIDKNLTNVKTVTDQLATAIELDGVEYRFTENALELSPALTAQETADAVNNLAPASTGATGSIRAKLDAIKLITDAIDTSAVTVTSSNNAGVLTFTQGSTFAATVSGLTISATWAKLYFTLKESDYDTDDLALLQLVETNPGAGTDGLLYLAGDAIASPITVADGTLTVSQAAGTVAIAITDNATALLSKASGLVWDIKTKDAAGATVQNTTGTASITRAVTQTI